MAGGAIPHEGCVSVPSTYPKLIPVKLAKVAQRFAPSAMGYGAFMGIAFIYFTDWKVFASKIPFYGSSFQEQEKD